MVRLTFREVMRSTAQKMLTDFKITRGINNNLSKGRAREYIILESFLKPYIPTRYSIGSGTIIDVQSRQSRQQDLLIYDQFNSPILYDSESEKVLFSESIFAAIEVKSSLGTNEIKDMVQNSASVQNLSKHTTSQLTYFPNHLLANLVVPTLCIGIAFESPFEIKGVLSRIRSEKSNIINGEALSVVCVLSDKQHNAGVIVNLSEDGLNRVEVTPSKSSRLGIVECDTAGDALLYTYFVLMEHLRWSSNFSSVPNLLEYIQLDEERNDLWIPNEEMRGATIKINDKSYNADETMRFRELGNKIQSGQYATDEEIIEFFSGLVKISGESTVDAQSKFFVDGIEVDYMTPIEIYEAIQRYRIREMLPDDPGIIKNFVSFFRSIIDNHKRLFISHKQT